MAKAKNSADSTVKKAPSRSKKAVTTVSGMTAAAGFSTSSIPTNGDLEERIRARAYELYQSRNGQNGSPESDWSRAEAEIRGMLERTA